MPGYGREDWVSHFHDWQGQNIYLFPKASRPGLGTTQSHIKFQVGVGRSYGKGGRSVKLTISLYQLVTFRLAGPTVPHSHMPQ